MKKSFVAFSTALSLIAFPLMAKKTPTIPKDSPLYSKKKSTFLSPPLASSEGSKSVIKLNLTQLAFRNFSFQYEYGFHKNMSGALGISLVIPRNIPGQIYSPPSKTEGWQIPKFSGFAITPEFRFYPGKKKNIKLPMAFISRPTFVMLNTNLLPII
ncbi:MAG: hypothetical protein IPG89_10055 [Bacteroidetes bacterium]|nr:hypothetical protein [Bacteroidota bacterium]